MKALFVGLSAIIVTIGTSGFSSAEMKEHDSASHSDHMQMTDTANAPVSPLTEPGQGAFAALSEVVRVLEADPNTDWSKVNITGLRDHLIDMDILVRNATVSHEMLDNGVRATVTGDAEILATAKRMVPAHAAELRKEDGWDIEAIVQNDSVVLIATSDDPATITRIKALGFYGLMASQDHHQAHHYIMATGGDAHAH
ncbi:MAG: hypothetical protein COA52_06625 [Hyphomicrobiales bacterium]|nr:MAG: hypothetical protein COA52_06625 [Hyphomicrobiales bacterium]